MKQRKTKLNISEKTNKFLTAILILFFLIMGRVWLLTVVQRDKKTKEAYKPQKRLVFDKIERANIYDSQGIILATNKVTYNVSISYAAIRELPLKTWVGNKDGSIKKIFLRKQYIKKLACFLAKELHLDEVFLEDIIHARASILGSIPYVVKEGISEKQFFRLKMKEKDWPGLSIEISPKRHYPLGKTGADFLGFVGVINNLEYKNISEKLKILRDCISNHEEGKDFVLPPNLVSIDEVYTKLKETERSFYNLNGIIGKAGIEFSYDPFLRGNCGRKTYFVDRKGDFVREIEEDRILKEEGHSLKLSINSELQKFAENLLIDNEIVPSRFVSSDEKKKNIPVFSPWIKGGSIIALDPNNGEILAMASYPRNDPNDFVNSIMDDDEFLGKAQVKKWLEGESRIADIWNFKSNLVREKRDVLKNHYYEETVELNWENFLDFILPRTSSVRKILDNNDSIYDAVRLQRIINELRSFFIEGDTPLSLVKILNFLYEGDVPLGGMTSVLSLSEKAILQNKLSKHQEEILTIKQALEPFFGTLSLNYDKLLLVDLYRLVVNEETFSEECLKQFGNMPLNQHREIEGLFTCIKEIFCNFLKEEFRETEFKKWREKNFSAFLEIKRKEEKINRKKYPLPYLDYLNQAFKKFFDEFWLKNKNIFMYFLLTGEKIKDDVELNPYYCFLNLWKQELNLGAHKALVWPSKFLRLNDLVSKSSKGKDFFSYSNTLRSFEELSRSLFGVYSFSPGNKNLTEKQLASSFYPCYGYGFCKPSSFRQAATLGSIFKLVPAYASLVKKYLEEEEKEQVNINSLNPLMIVDQQHKTENGRFNLGFFKSGEVIPVYYKGGRLPKNTSSGHGKLDLLKALEVSNNTYFSLLAGDVLEYPEDICHAASLLGFGEKTGIDLPGEYPGSLPNDVSYNKTGLYSLAIGQHSLVTTPLQAANLLATIVNGGKLLVPHIVKSKFINGEWEDLSFPIKREIFLPKEIRSFLIQGLSRVIMGANGTARELKRFFPESLLSSIIGKTSTAEHVERVSLDGKHGTMIMKNAWFLAAGFENEKLEKPEIVVIVYLRKRDFGRQAAPLAIKIIEKWKELKKIRTN